MTGSEKDNNILAAEYALGLLEGEELEHAHALLASDVEFVAEVTDWEI